MGKYLIFKKVVFRSWILMGVIFTLWLIYSYQSKGVDPGLLRADKLVFVENKSSFYAFTPRKAYRNVLIFYPGALVDPRAYVSICRKLSENGIKEYLIKMPWRLASKGYLVPKKLNLFGDTTKRYILAGHSQGGKMAARFVFEHPGLADKLVLIGTTHPRDFSLVDVKIPILKIYGSRDGVADEASVLKNRNMLPSQAKLVRIEGANHSQFGYYGFQLGDHKARISRLRQQEETLNQMLKFIVEH